MNKQNFPAIALLVSVLLLSAIAFGGPDASGATRLPLLTLLLVSELGAIVNAIAVYVGLPALRERPLPWRRLLRWVANLLLVAVFVLHLTSLWPG